LKDTKEGQAIYLDYANVASKIDSIRKAISQARKQSSKMATVANIVQVHHFVLPCIYLFEPVNRGTLTQLVRNASNADEYRVHALMAGALAMLNKNREIELTTDGYKLSSLGLKHFATLGKRGNTGRTINLKAMDDLRVAILNWQNRGKCLKIHEAV
jgi:hypothetical protein